MIVGLAFEPLGGQHQGSMTSHDMPTPEALTRSVPHFSLQALNHLITEITPHLPPPPRRGPKGMAITTRVRLALAHLREGVSLRGLARILGIPPTTLRDNVNPVLAAFDQLAPLLPDGTAIADFDDIAWWCAEHAGTIIVVGTEFGVGQARWSSRTTTVLLGQEEAPHPQDDRRVRQDVEPDVGDAAGRGRYS